MRKFIFGLVALAVFSVVTCGTALAAFSFGNVGPKADIAAVSAAKQKGDSNVQIHGVHVTGDYALVVWGDSHECCPQALYKRISGERWKKLGEGGGQMYRDILIQWGAPPAVATTLCSGWPKNYKAC